jgi:hypothetical protein
LSEVPAIIWDTCCFIRFVTRNPNEFLGDLDQFVKEAQGEKVQIFYSTVTYVEFRPRFFKGSRYGEISKFFSDFRRVFHPIEPNPQILMWSGRLRDADPVNPSDPKIADDLKRKVGAGDAIHMATAVYLRDVAGYSDIVMHTFDKGKKKSTAEGNCVPIIGFENWFPRDKRSQEVQAVCDLKREEPRHPSPDLAAQGSP